ncbi:MAG: L-lactate permease [Alphaproteobacteria bacterium]|nr:L-lactate permease [Alphaproteobacteria bacterium]
MLVLLAAAPILLAALTILWARRGAATAGLMGLISAILLAVTVFDPRFDLATSADVGLRTALIAAPILYVLLGGVLLYRVLQTGGALDTLADLVARTTPDPGLRVLLLVFGLGVFFESATGFGVGTIVVAPLFLVLGYPPVMAAFLALLAQAAVPWGALAIGTELGARLSGVPIVTLSLWAAGLTAPFIVLCGWAGLRAVGIHPTTGRAPYHLAITSGTMIAAIVATTAAGAPELAGCAAGLAVVLVCTVIGHTGATVSGAPVDRRQVRAAILPLAVLIAALSITRMVPEVRAVLQGVWVLAVPVEKFTLSPLHHPGFWLIVAAIVAVPALSLSPRRAAGALVQGLRQWVFAASAILGFIAMGQVMAASGMTDALAAPVASAPRWLATALAPVIGAIGGYLTASNAGSNAIFMPFQLTVAEIGGISTALIVGAQNAGASIACLASPGRVALACLVTGQQGGEHALMKRALPIVGLGLIAMAALLVIIPR